MSQCATILRLLTEARGEWVELTTLAREAGCYAVSERVSELRRKHGHDIINETITQPDGQKHSRYRLLLTMTGAPFKPLRAAAATDLFPTNKDHHE